MHLEQLKGSYNSIISLGFNCTPSIQLQNNQLRMFSGVLDWMITDQIPDLCRLLRQRFQGFFEFPYLTQTDLMPEYSHYIVYDFGYNVVSNHDFPKGPQIQSFLDTYDAFKIKMNRRIDRLLHKMATEPRLLFIRLKGTAEEAIELREVLSQLVTHDFAILLVNYTAVPVIVDLQCPYDKICAVELPSFDMYRNSIDPNWNHLLQGIQLI